MGCRGILVVQRPELRPEDHLSPGVLLSVEMEHPFFYCSDRVSLCSPGYLKLRISVVPKGCWERAASVG